VRLEDLSAADPARTISGPWLGAVRQVRLPSGGLLEAEVRDGGNCFNLNSLVRSDNSGGHVADGRMVQQFAALLQLLGTDSGRAMGIAEAAADWIDSDEFALPSGAEASSYGPAEWRPSNGLIVDASELGAVRGVTPEIMSVAAPFLCALPEAMPSAINPNTLAPEQALLVAMLAPGVVSLDQARALVTSRPVGGFASSVDFWQSPVLGGLAVPAEAAEQIRLKSRWFELRATLDQEGQKLASTTLIDLTSPRARIVRRRYGEAS
jgi:general secretion pathway protein K